MHALALVQHIQQRPKLLLVDDRSENLFALKTSMRALHAEIHTAESGNEALAKMLENCYALVVLDVQMPGMDGFEVAALMRSNPATREVPIIFVTAISKEEQYRLRGYETGAVDYLLKPIDPVVLLSKVRVFLRLDEQKLEIDHAMRELRRLSHRNNLILTCAEEGVLGLDRASTIVFANAAAERVAGAAGPGALVGASVRDLFAEPRDAHALIDKVIAGGDHSRGIESRFLRCDGTTYPVEFSVGAVPVDSDFDAGVGGVLVFRDISERKKAEEKLLRMALHDHLTGLGNRTMFYNGLTAALARASRSGQTLAVMMIDLDDFKLINDELGHDCGDKVLVEVAERLTRAVRAGDLVARLGGDEFAVVLEDVGSAKNAERVGNTIVSVVSAQIDLGSKATHLGCSVGIAMPEESAQNAEALLKMADTAMYSIKQKGRNGVAVFCANMVAGASRRIRISKELELAIREQTMMVHYQPQFHCNERHVLGVEALARWHHAELGFISPGEFIPVAEQSGQIEALGDFVLRQSLLDFRHWLSTSSLPQSARLAVNMSAVQLGQRDFPRRVAQLLDELGVEPGQLELELTETAVMRDPALSTWCLEALFGLGVHLAVDDFGTGYASLSYLQRFPIDTLKIDRSFVAKIGQSRNDDALVNTILGLGHDLGMRVVAEGVETEEQAEFLAAKNCDVLQGFLLARPQARGEIEQVFGVDAATLRSAAADA